MCTHIYFLEKYFLNYAIYLYRDKWLKLPRARDYQDTEVFQ